MEKTKLIFFGPRLKSVYGEEAISGATILFENLINEINNSYECINLIGKLRNSLKNFRIISKYF